MGTKIIELPVTSAVLGDGYIPISQDATGSNRNTYKVTAQQIANYVGATTSSGTVNNVAVECADGSLAVTGSPITIKGVINVSVNSVTLDKINSGGATNGQVLTYDGIVNQWKPIDSSNTGVTADSVQIGTVLWFAASSAPLGYLECNGSSKRISDYPQLAVLLGTTYGALLNGGTEFILPDLRGEFIRGWDNGRAANTGRVFGSNEEGSAMVTHVGQTAGGAMAIGGANFDSTQAYTTANVQIAGTLTNFSGNRLVGSRPRNVALLPCIKALKTVTTTSSLLNFIEKPISPTNGEILTYNQSTSTWVASAAQNFKLSDQLLANKGYQKLPGGLIMQWGTVTKSTVGTYKELLPIIFSSQIFCVIGSNAGSATGPLGYTNDVDSSFVGKDGTSLSSIQVTVDGFNFSTSWFAIGC